MSTPPPPEGTRGPAGQPPHRRRSRRRRGRGRRERADAAPPRAAAPIVPEASHIATTPAGGDRLAPGEVAEMREHLVFLRRYKDMLRLKLNASEDLLVNGQREPTDRGVCRHLLGKLDRAVIDAAVSREPLRSDPAARARMLAGAIRVTADVGVLLAYLETLAHVRSRAEAAQAFAEVVRRIDFESLSATRLARLLQVLTETFVDHERVQVLFSLLAEPSFRRAFDAAAGAFPPAVADAFAPLRAVHRRLLEPGAPADGLDLLAAGMQQLLSAPDPVLRGYAERLRVGMLELALRPDVPPALGDRAAGVLLASLPRDGKTYARLALQRASQLLQRHADDRARVVLDEIRRAQPGIRAAERWLAALGARRLGRVALDAGGLPERGRLAVGFWLDGQRTAWVRTAPAADAARLGDEARLQAGLALAGVATVIEHGVASGIPYIAVAAPGRPLALDAHLDAGPALALAATVARILRGIALTGAMLPDLEPTRFLFAPPNTVTLADLDGVRAADPAQAARTHAAQAASLARRIVPAAMEARLPADAAARLRGALGQADGLLVLVAALEHAALIVGRE